MPWYFMLAAAVGLSVDTFVLSMAFAAQVRTRASIVGFVLLSILASAALVIGGASLTSLVISHVAIELPDVGNVLVAILGFGIFAESLRCQEKRSYQCGNFALMTLGVVLANLDAAAFGSALSMRGHDALPMALTIACTSAIASISGFALGRWTSSLSDNQAQAYGGIVLFSLGLAGMLA
ncbi:MAG TPA: hypothetical protein DDW52_10635 [Planctomycetaceae bacterium]|nr:hypothetical protein [Planctomycetaceae bacterium]